MHESSSFLLQHTRTPAASIGTLTQGTQTQRRKSYLYNNGRAIYKMYAYESKLALVNVVTRGK